MMRAKELKEFSMEQMWALLEKADQKVLRDTAQEGGGCGGGTMDSNRAGVG